MSWNYSKRFLAPNQPVSLAAHEHVPAPSPVLRTPRGRGCRRLIWNSLFPLVCPRSPGILVIPGGVLRQMCFVRTVTKLQYLLTLEVRINDRSYREDCSGTGARKPIFDESIRKPGHRLLLRRQSIVTRSLRECKPQCGSGARFSGESRPGGSREASRARLANRATD